MSRWVKYRTIGKDQIFDIESCRDDGCYWPIDKVFIQDGIHIGIDHRSKRKLALCFVRPQARDSNSGRGDHKAQS